MEMHSLVLISRRVLRLARCGVVSPHTAHTPGTFWACTRARRCPSPRTQNPLGHSAHTAAQRPAHTRSEIPSSHSERASRPRCMPRFRACPPQDGGADRSDLDGGADRSNLDGGADRSDLDGGADRSDLDGGADRSDLDGCADRSDLDGCADRSNLDGGADRYAILTPDHSAVPRWVKRIWRRLRLRDCPSPATGISSDPTRIPWACAPHEGPIRSRWRALGPAGSARSACASQRDTCFVRVVGLDVPDKCMPCRPWTVASSSSAVLTRHGRRTKAFWAGSLPVLLENIVWAGCTMGPAPRICFHDRGDINNTVSPCHSIFCLPCHPRHPCSFSRLQRDPISSFHPAPRP
jgi:hypothetical protein